MIHKRLYHDVWVDEQYGCFLRHSVTCVEIISNGTHLCVGSVYGNMSLIHVIISI